MVSGSPFKSNHYFSLSNGKTETINGKGCLQLIRCDSSSVVIDGYSYSNLVAGFYIFLDHVILKSYNSTNYYTNAFVTLFND